MRKDGKIQVNLLIHKDRLDVIDELADTAGVSRSEFLRESALDLTNHFGPTVRHGIRRIAERIGVDSRFLVERLCAEYVAVYEAALVLDPTSTPDIWMATDRDIPHAEYIEARRGEIIREMLSQPQAERVAAGG